jgi:hypothetical protein
MTGEIIGNLGSHSDSVESIAICKSEKTPFCVSCGMDTRINIYNIKENSLR